MKKKLPCWLGLLFIALLYTAQSQNRNITLFIQPVFGNKPLTLEKEKYITGTGDTVQIDLLRFYISSIELMYAEDTLFSEAGSYHLTDASKEESLRISLKNVPPGTIRGIRFMIGVDSTACVSGALEGDLDPVNGMYWAWNSGYVNAKLEGRSNSCKTLHHTFEFHVGGYLPNEKSMRKTALAVEEKNNIIAIAADVSHWFSGIQLEKTNSIVIPGAEAIKMADRYKTMFRPAQ